MMTRTERRELAACERLTIELTRDERGWIGRVHQEDVTLKTTSAYPSMTEAARSAEWEWDQIVEERVDAAEREARAIEDGDEPRMKSPTECHGAWG